MSSVVSLGLLKDPADIEITSRGPGTVTKKLVTLLSFPLISWASRYEIIYMLES